MEMLFDKNVLALQQTVQRAGYACVIVGGAVRDALRGCRPTDYDLASSASSDALLKLLPGAVSTGGEYGTVTVRCPESGVSCEITPFRAEGRYTDGRHPDEVTFGVSAEEDLARRDFTINAMAWDGTRLLDPFQGQVDLAAGVIRTVGDPMRRFTEDGLRILRAFRFASTLHFTPEPALLEAAAACRGQLRAVSLPRIKSELQAAVLGRAPQALDSLLASGALRWLGIRGEDFCPAEKAEHSPAPLASLAPLEAVPCRMLLRWWAFLTITDTDKRFFCTKLNFADSFYRDLVLLDSFFAQPADRITLKRRASRRLPLPMEEILQAFCALSPRFEENRRLWKEILEKDEPYRISQLAITGRDLMGQGLRGPAVGRRLELLLELVLAEPALNRSASLSALSSALDTLAL